MLNENRLESSTKILYSIKGLSGDLKVYWSRLLSFTDSSLTQSQIQQRQIIAAAKPFASLEEVAPFFRSLDEEDQAWILASYRFLIERALKTNDWMSHRQLIQFIKLLDTPRLASSIEDNFRQIQIQSSEFEERKSFSVPASVAIISFDYLLRWLLLIFGNLYSIGSEIIAYNFIILFPVLAFAYWLFRKDKKYNEALIKKNGVTSLYKIKFKFSAYQYTTIGFYIITSIIIIFLITDNTSGAFALGILLLCFYILLLSIYPVGRLSEDNLLQQIHFAEKTSSLDADSNDEVIVQIETQLNSSTGRLEAYVLESALFGALAFSGFLQIIATDLISFDDLEKFASTCHHVSRAFVLANWNEFNYYSSLLKNKTSLFCLVSIETLICSALFLAVIAARLRFSDVADKVRSTLNLAKAYNEKEEMAIEKNSTDEKSLFRIASLNKKINDYLIEAQDQLRGVEPIVSYMVYFRNAGLFTFLGVLVSSSLFVSGFLGWSFISIGAATLIYFNLKIIHSHAHAFVLSFRIYFARNDWSIFTFAIFPALLGFFLRTGIKLSNTDFLVALSFILIGTYFFVWLVLMPHPDNRFGDIENLQDEIWRSNRWKIIKIVYGILVLISFAGFSFKMNNMTSANETLIVGISGMSLMNYFIGFYLTRPKWLGALTAIMLGTISIGLLFRLQHWNGAEELLMSGLVMLPIFFILYMYKRKSFHYILFRIFTLSLILTLFISSLIMKPSILRRIQFMYNHRTLAVKNIIDLNNKIQPDMSRKIDLTAFELSLKSCDYYIQTYGTQNGWTEIYSQASGYYYELADYILYSHFSKRIKLDTVTLQVAQRAAHQANKINSLFNNYNDDVVLESQALVALGKTDKAILFLQSLPKKELNEGTRKVIDQELERLSKKK